MFQKSSVLQSLELSIAYEKQFDYPHIVVFTEVIRSMAGVRLRGLTSSKLYQRRQDRLSGTGSLWNDGKERAAGIFG